MRLRSRGFVVSLFTVAGATLALAGTAGAATINVPGNNDKTIQQGVNRAEPGDTVAIQARKRPYFENVVVTTNRLKIVGVARRDREVIVDGTSRDGDTHGLSFDIDANKVTLRNITSRHGTGIDCTGDDCTFERFAMSMSDHGGDCIEIDGARAEVRNSSFIGCDSNVISVIGQRARIIGNYMRQSDSDCLDLDGDNYRVVRNRMRGCEDGNAIEYDGDDSLIHRNSGINTDNDGFDVSGDRNVLSSNLARNHADDSSYEVDGNRNRLLDNRGIHTAGSDCFDVSGVANRIKGNRARFCSGGYDIDGENMTVINNRSLDSPDDDGFNISCFDLAGGVAPTDACREALVESNFAADNGDDDEGFQISDDTSRGMIVRGNVSEDNNNGGFDLDLDNARISDNVSRRDGAEGNEPGLEIDGNGNLIKKNRTYSSGDDALQVRGDDNRLVLNVTRRSNIDGIDLESGAGNVIRRNVALGNFGDGIENGADNTRITGNFAVGNRRDCVNDGTIAFKRNNTCVDGSNFNRPSTVDRVPRRQR